VDDEVPRVLVIEDDPVAGRLISSHLSSSGYEPVEWLPARRGLEQSCRGQTACHYLDVTMTPVTGGKCSADSKLMSATADIPVIMVTLGGRESCWDDSRLRMGIS